MNNSSERRFFALAFIILFLLSVVDCLVRTLHDTLLLTGTEHGAEALPFIDFWLVLPSAILFTALYAQLARFWSLERLFFFTSSGFLLFFVCFAFLLYPESESLRAVHFTQWLKSALSPRLNGLITAFDYWPLTLFYVVSALWKPMIMVVMFWGWLNRSVSVEQAGRFYGPIMASQSLAGLTAGQLAIYHHRCFSSGVGWEEAFQALMIVVALIGLGALLLFQVMRQCSLQEGVSPQAPDRSSPTLLQSIVLLMRSPYLLGLALIVLADNIGYTLMQPLWKHYLKSLYPAPLDFMNYNGYIMTFTAGLTGVLSLSTSRILRRFGWTATAMITPMVLVAASAFFFFFILAAPLPSVQQSTLFLFGVSPIAAGVFCGAVCECLCRSCKTTLLDTSKELAFVPLNARTQVYAKAAIDGVGGRLGKSAGSLIQQTILIAFTSVTSTAFPIALLVLCFALAAVQAVKRTGREFRALNE